jgi:hypothetical protein
MPTFHLVVDDVVPVDKFQFHMRMWREAGFPAIALSSQVPGHPPPDWYSSLLGNLVLRSFLGYALPIPVFFELSILSEKARAFRVRFETRSVELRAADCALHKIRQHRNYEMKARARLGGHLTTRRVAFLVQQGLRLMTASARCYTLDCTCCILTATSAELDAIVQSGLKNGSIAVQSEAA